MAILTCQQGSDKERQTMPTSNPRSFSENHMLISGIYMYLSPQCSVGGYLGGIYSGGGSEVLTTKIVSGLRSSTQLHLYHGGRHLDPLPST